MTRIEQERASVIDKARSASFLDAVFVILRFNLSHHRSVDVDDIEPHEVWDDVEEPVYAAARKRAVDLYAARFEIGEEFHQCRIGTDRTQQLRAKVEQIHPGFSSETYGQVISDGAIAAR